MPGRAQACNVCPGIAKIAGRVQVGEAAFIGLGANIIQCTHEHRRNDAIVGAGAVVLKDVPDGITVVGVPARALASTQAGTATSSA